MISLRAKAARSLAPATAWLVVFLASGCGDDSGVGKTYPVSGKVLMDQQPLQTENGSVMFKPNAARGNTSTFEPSGMIDKEGEYTLTTNGKKGAPPGWYKVIVSAHGGSPEHPKFLDTQRSRRPVAQSLLPPRYGNTDTTPLEIEVVASPGAGAYDLHLSR